MQAAAAHLRKQADINSLPASRGLHVPEQDTLLTDVILKQYETRKLWTSSQAQPISLQQLPSSASRRTAPPTNPLKAVQHALYDALRDAAESDAKTHDDVDDRASPPLEQTQAQTLTLKQSRVYIESLVALPPPLDAVLICDSPATAQVFRHSCIISSCEVDVHPRVARSACAASARTHIRTHTLTRMHAH
eukprot:4524512-Pleurochrysis_carterae.AAC.4